MKSEVWSFAALSLLASLPVPVVAQQALYVDITEGNVAPLAIGVPALTAELTFDEAHGADVGVALAGIVSADLATSGFFRVSHSSPTGQFENSELVEQFAALGLQALVVGRPVWDEDGSLLYSCSLFDVFSGTLEEQAAYRVPRSDWRRAAHQCADMVYSHTTGYGGHFDTRFLQASVSDEDSTRISVLTAFDFDGASPTEISRHTELLAMPRFSPGNRRILYLRYAEGMPGLSVIDLRSGRETRLQLPPGLPSAARFSPDGQYIALALSRNGETDIYEIELATGRTSRLTDTTGIDTSPSYAPDGSAISFESDRAGDQQIYIMRRDGSDQRRISFGSPHGSPVWSPDGNLIAFARIAEGQSRIGVMRPDGGGERLLTDGPFDEDPSWAPDGRAVAFQRPLPEATGQHLHIVELDGRKVSRIPVPNNGRSVNWSEIQE